MNSNLKFATTLAALSVLAPTVLSAQAVSAQPAGLQGSYIGITVDGNKAGDSLSALIEAGNPESWILDEALRLYGVRTGSKAESSDSQTRQETTERQFQGRLDLPNTPISVRGAVFLGDNSKALVPMLSYDLPVSDFANVYAGAGYALVKTSGEATPLGDRNGIVLTTGAEAAISDGIVIYGDAKLGLNGDSGRGNFPARLQVGAGYRF